jgi:hypothetical protein
MLGEVPGYDLYYSLTHHKETYYSTCNENYSSIWPWRCCAYKLNNFGVVGRSAKN